MQATHRRTVSAAPAHPPSKRYTTPAHNALRDQPRTRAVPKQTTLTKLALVTRPAAQTARAIHQLDRPRHNPMAMRVFLRRRCSIRIAPPKAHILLLNRKRPQRRISTIRVVPMPNLELRHINVDITHNTQPLLLEPVPQNAARTLVKGLTKIRFTRPFLAYTQFYPPTNEKVPRKV